MSSEGEQNRDYQKHAFDHAWKYFEYHANQRVTLFRFYIIFFGLIAAGAGIVYINYPKVTIMHELAGVAISIVFFIISVVFWLLDTRNKEMIERAEEAMRKLEVSHGYLKDNPDYAIFSKDWSEEHKKPCHSHSTYFKIIFSIGMISSVVFLLTTTYMMHLSAHHTCTHYHACTKYCSSKECIREYHHSP